MAQTFAKIWNKKNIFVQKNTKKGTTENISTDYFV